MASQVDLQSLLESAAGERIGRESSSSTHFLALTDRVFLKTLAEPDVMETSASRQVMFRESPLERAKS